jgi:hypothetical protein
MTALNSLFRWIETRDAVLMFLTLALVAQVPQVAALVLHVVGNYDWLSYIHAYMFAIALDGAILIFVTRQQVGLAWVFAVGSMLMNASHYMPPVMARHASLVAPLALVDMAGAVLLSIALPFALAQYSHLASHDGASVTLREPQQEAGKTTPTPAETLETPSDTSPRALCAYEGCTNEAYACEHECGARVCMTHKGPHNQWRCTHNPRSKGYQGALNGHAEGLP